MKYLKSVWGWKFRILMILILITSFLTKYPDGFIVAILNAFGVYAIMAIAQGAQIEIKEMNK